MEVGLWTYMFALAHPTTPIPPSSAPERVGHATAHEVVMPPQLLPHHLSMSSHKTRNTEKILTFFILWLIQPRRYLGSNLITNKIIPILTKENQNLNTEVKSVPTAL